MVGEFIRKHREQSGLSQRELGLRFEPPVTTQFISNMERGVTPLPATHLPKLAALLKVSEKDLIQVIQKDHGLRISGRAGLGEAVYSALAGDADQAFLDKVSNAYRQASPETRIRFADFCKSLFQIHAGNA